LLLPVLLLLSSLGPPGEALAKDTPKPVVMLLMDSSGSMEYRVGATSIEGEHPVCHDAKQEGFIYEKSRWIAAVEVLTGTYNDYWCSYDNRLDDPTREDYADPVTHVVAHATAVDGESQRKDGLLDIYADSVKFGLMMFEVRPSIETTQAGGFSYGQNKTYGGVTSNVGARNGEATWGALVSPPLDDDLASMRQSNADMQDQILSAFPYGGTPIGPMLDDALFYFKNDPNVKPYSDVTGEGDPYFDCRPKHVILITDGQPNIPQPDGSKGYPTSQVAAALLAAEGITVHVVGYDMPESTFPMLDKLAKAGGDSKAYIVKNQPELVAALGAILLQIQGSEPSRSGTTVTNRTMNLADKQYQFNAAFGGTCTSPLDQVGLLDQLVFRCQKGCSAVDPLSDLGFCEVFSVSGALNKRTEARTILTQLAGQFVPFAPDTPDVTADLLDLPVSGELPRLDPLVNPDGQKVFSGIVLGDASDPSVREEYRKQLIRLVSAAAGSRREGIAMGAIYHSDPVVQPNLFSVASQIPSFLKYRNKTEIRNRPTALFVGTHDGQMHAFRVDRGADLAASDYGMEMWSFIPKTLLPKLNTLASAVTYLMDSTPVVQEIRLYKEAAVLGLDEESERWRSVLVSGYRGGARGYFALDVTLPDSPKLMWEISHQERCSNVSGAPPSCNPTNDFFRLGYSYGKPAIGTVFWNNVGSTEERAVAVFGGGEGIPTEGNPDCDCSKPKVALWHRGPGGQPPKKMCVSPMAVIVHLLHGDTLIDCGAVLDAPGSGKTLYVVNLETGELMQEFCNSCGNVEDGNSSPNNEAPLDCPLVGHMTGFDASIGGVMTRGFIGDACGQLWRLDLSSADPKAWKLTFFHDAFQGMPLDSVKRRRVALPPSLAVGEERGRLLVVYGTGDPDDQLKVGQSDRVSSLREYWDGDKFIAKENWTITLQPGEKYTSPAVVYDRVAYFTTQAAGDGLCNIGIGRLWGVDYDGESDTTTDDVVPRLDMDGDPLTDDTVTFIEYQDSELMGVNVVQRPSCSDQPGDYTPWSSGVTQEATVPPVGSTPPGGGTGGMMFSGSSGGSPQVVVQTGQTGASSPGMQAPEGGGVVQTGNKAVHNLSAPPKTLFSTSWSMVFD
jgi:hypothetical protein